MDICFVADENYAPYMATVIYSILKNNKNMDCFDFYIFDNGILEKTKKNLLKIVDEKVSIKFINCLPFEKNLNELNQIAEHITKTSYLKFVIADTLNHLDKVLYLDCDLVVMSDLEELWKYELENNLLAAVEDVGYTYWSKSNEKLKLKFKCINSGVMLINCNLWRKEKLFKKFMKCAKKHEVVGYGQDQPVLNYVCKNRILYLPFIWNVQDTFFRRGIEIQNRTDIQECDFARINPAIIHYTYIEKPWNNINIFNAIYFWKYYKDTPWGNNKGECIYKKLQASYPYYRNIEYPFTLSVRTKNACISGWNLPEPEGTWTAENTASLAFTLAETPVNDLCVTLKFYMFSMPDINNFIKITTKDNQVLFDEKYPDTQNAAEVKFIFPRTQIGKDNIVCFNLLSNTRFRISIHPDSNDPRKLGVFLKSVKLSFNN